MRRTEGDAPAAQLPGPEPDSEPSVEEAKGPLPNQIPKPSAPPIPRTTQMIAFRDFMTLRY